MKQPATAPRPARRILAVLLAACLPAAALAAQGQAKADADAPRLSYAVGAVAIDGKPADVGAAVPDGALLKTGPGAQAEIVFRGKNIIRVGENSAITFSLAGLKRSAQLKQGTFSAVLRKLDKALGGEFTLRTPTAQAGVRGTSFCARVDANGYSYFCACNGSLYLQDSLGGQGFTDASAHHKAYRFTSDGRTLKVAPAGLEYHTDADIENLAARIGETVDWNTLER